MAHKSDTSAARQTHAVLVTLLTVHQETAFNLDLNQTIFPFYYTTNLMTKLFHLNSVVEHHHHHHHYYQSGGGYGGGHSYGHGSAY